MESIYQTERFIIRTYEIDNRKQATAPALVKLMHEAAMQHVIRLKLSVWDLEAEQISWVLMRKMLRIHRMPKLGEQIKVVTYPAGFEKFFTYRDYKVFDEKDDLIAWSSSTWLLMDTVERRLSRIPEHILRLREQMPPPSECLPRPEDRLPRMESAQRVKTFEVNWHDLDFNMHLNNTYYVQWMIEAVPDDRLRHSTLQEFDILYRAECMWKDQIRSESSRLDDRTWLHRLVRAADSKELALGKSTWTEMEID